MASTHSEAQLYAGPGDSYDISGLLPPGVEVEIVERNRIGNWLHVQRPGDSRRNEVDAWVMSGYLTLGSEVRFSQVPINAQIPDANLTNVASERLARLYGTPVISSVSASMQLVYRRGLALGNEGTVVTKVGDSLTADPIYLTPLVRDDHVLGPYDYLTETVEIFGEHMAYESLAARLGMTSYGVSDPMWADGEQCRANESPLACEYRVRRPSVAFIMFGPNDVRQIDAEEFDDYMRAIVEETLAGGIIPVLSTFSFQPTSRFWEDSVAFNLTVVDIANDYQVPLINLWLASRTLPRYGLDGDDVHMRHSGFRNLKFDTGHESWFGVSLRNLLSIRMLDEIRRTIGIR